ncbi:MAG: exodeoxyribonuclease V subunit gamma [Deferribacterales bacterium]
MLNIYIGNNLKNLINIMSEKLYDPAHPLRKPVVCVQTSGMQRWIGLKLAEQTGISANLDYLFPAALIRRVAERHFGPENLWVDRQQLTWRIYRILTEAKDNGVNTEIINYISKDPRKIKTFRLAQKIADIFDQYQIYRPAMVKDWLTQGAHERTKNIESWQPWLFSEAFPDKNRCKTFVLRNFMKDCSAGRVDLANIDTVHLFGISVIPRFFMEVLFAVSGGTDVNLYLLCPSAEYFGDSMSDREISYAEKRTGKTREELMMFRNHPLLDNLGTMGRDFFEFLTANDNANIRYEYFDEPPANTLLGEIQAEIYDFAKRDGITPDGSIVINSCHNPLREVQVLYDFMLDTLADDDTITPADILVMTPDIQRYAPYIRAVFDNPYGEKETIPYTIADIPAKAESRTANVFSELVSAVTGEFSLSAVIKLIESPVISGRFAISRVSDMAEVLERNGAYWGIDAEAMRADGITADIPFTWDRAMRRLALGLAEGGRRAIYTEAAGNDVPFSMAKQLGGLMRFVELCTNFSKMLNGERRADEWCSILSEMADSFLSTEPEYADENVNIAKMIADVRTETEDCRINMPFRPIYETISGKLDEVKTSKGFITGKTTFCAMLPMRSIPFRVICVLGMDDGAFPRLKTEPEFDLISAKPDKGDRTQRESDKYLFLETLISAKDRLYLSYTGRSETDNRLLVPSIAVTELLRHLKERFGMENTATEHPLHSFSRKYFKGDGKLFTYSPERYAAASVFGTQYEERNFCTGELPAEMPLEVSLEAFERFFMNPPGYFLNSTLGIELSEKFEALPDTERLVLDALQQYNLRAETTRRMLNSENAGDLLAYAQATAQIPAGGLGEGYKQKITRESGQVCEAVTAHGTPFSITDSITVGNLRINFRIDNITEDGLIYTKNGKLKPKDLLKARIRHLILLNKGYDINAILINIEGERTFLSADCRKEALQTYAEIFLNGLKSPFCFTPDDGFKAFRKVYKKLYPDVKEDDTAGVLQEFALCFGRDGYADKLAQNGILVFSAPEKDNADQ